MMALGSVQNQYLDGTYSMSCAQGTYAAADRAVIAIIRQCHEDARRMLEENRELLDQDRRLSAEEGRPSPVRR